MIKMMSETRITIVMKRERLMMLPITRMMKITVTI